MIKMYDKKNLSNMVFEREDLKSAIFINTNLDNTKFHMCDLSDAAFRNCENIETASFKRCNLEGARFDDIKILNNYLNCPSHGAFIAWKATTDAIVKLLVPEDAIRITPIGTNHCRVSKVQVLEIIDKDGNNRRSTLGKYFKQFYRVGQIIEDKNINTDVREWCERGIGIYPTRRKAEEFL